MVEFAANGPANVNVLPVIAGSEVGTPLTAALPGTYVGPAGKVALSVSTLEVSAAVECRVWVNVTVPPLLVNAVADEPSDTVSGFVAAGIGGIELNELGDVCLICWPDAIS